MELLERDGELASVRDAIGASRDSGRVVTVVGEAGVGKTSLVSAACSALPRRLVLWGGCDPLITPRPLGPLRDVARSAGGALEAAIEQSREAVLAAALDELAAGRVLVVDDLHWADDTTLDLVVLLGRRLAHGSGCLVLICRSDALGERPGVRRVLASLPREVVVNVRPRPLSAEAVALLARRAGRDPADLHAVSGGNPFFVTEVLAGSPDDSVPAGVREAVTLRLASVGPAARAVAEVAAVVPRPAPLWLVERTVGADHAAVDACVEAGLLHLVGDALAFRHDLARRAAESALPPVRRRALDAAVLQALEAAGSADPARLVHHARRAGDPGAVRRLGPAAARAASRAGGHRQALEHWEAVLEAEGDDGPGRAAALEGVAVEGYLCGRLERALDARRALLDAHRAAGDRRKVGDDLRWISRLLWWLGRGAEAAAAGDEAIQVLEALPDGPELARALSGRSQLAMLEDRNDAAVALGTRAADLARRLGDRETLAHALANVGTAQMSRDPGDRGRAMLEEAHALAVAAGEDDHAARSLVNLATGTVVRRRDDPRAAGDLERALRFAFEHELDGYVQYLLGVRATLRLRAGDWTGAEADGRASLATADQMGVSLVPALVTLGLLHVRRGEPETGMTLSDAWRIAVPTAELQRLAPIATARAEHAWLDGDPEGVSAAVRTTYALAVERGERWERGELGWWLRRAGEPVSPRDDDPLPYARAMAGDWRRAADAFRALGWPYERAHALADGDDEGAWLEALAVFDGLGATRAAAWLRRRMRAAGVRRIPRGPRAASRTLPGGLTPREAEVLGLLAEGATNAQIAGALVISPKTVDHHVSAVLGKLGVRSRRDAAAAAARLGAAAPR